MRENIERENHSLRWPDTLHDLNAGQAPERPRHIRGPLPLLRSRPGGVRSLAIARLPEPDKNCVIADLRFPISQFAIADCPI